MTLDLSTLQEVDTYLDTRDGVLLPGQGAVRSLPGSGCGLHTFIDDLA